jgi:hypothetical protein
MSKKRKKLRGTVDKVIKSKYANEPEKAEININEADNLYREIPTTSMVAVGLLNTGKYKKNEWIVGDRRG